MAVRGCSGAAASPTPRGTGGGSDQGDHCHRPQQGPTAGPFGLELDLRGSDLVLPSGIAFDGTISPNSARGTINGGGPRITAVTGGGTVTFEIGK